QSIKSTEESKSCKGNANDFGPSLRFRNIRKNWPSKRNLRALELVRDGTIDFNEFVHMMSERMLQDEENTTRKERQISELSLSLYSTRMANGLIDSQELKRVMESLGEKLTDQEIDEMIAEADKNGDGFVDYADPDQLDPVRAALEFRVDRSVGELQQAAARQPAVVQSAAAPAATQGSSDQAGLQRGHWLPAHRSSSYVSLRVLVKLRRLPDRNPIVRQRLYELANEAETPVAAHVAQTWRAVTDIDMRKQ
uniref:EF-hand domain-containing protein n=1 Tax=Macrostomum lignano TaxID=282301 RepID=A0A1I8JS20_9PLAT